MASPKIKDLAQTVVGIENAEIDPGDKDGVLVKKVNTLVEDARPILEEKKKEWENILIYFDGDPWQRERIGGRRQEYQSDTHLNRLFPTIRNLVGFLSDARPKPEISPAPVPSIASDAAPEEKEKYSARIEANVRKAKLYDQICEQHWMRIGMPEKQTQALYSALLKADAWFQPLYNPVTDDLDIELRKNEEVLIDPTILFSGRIEDARWIAFEVWKNRQWIRDHYPEKEKDVDFAEARTEAGIKTIPQSLMGKEAGGRMLKDQVLVRQVFTVKAQVITAGDGDKAVVLDKGEFPYWERRTPYEQWLSWVKGKRGLGAEVRGLSEDGFTSAREQGLLPEDFEPVTNYFDRPRLPIMPLRTYNSGSLYSHNLVNQLLSVQRTIDKRKQQIDDILNTMGNPQKVYDSNAMTKEESAMLSNQPGLLIGISDVNKIKNLEASQPPAFTLEDLRHSEYIFDTIFGQHDISRGTQDRVKSATEAEILRQSDRTSVRLISRNIEDTGKLIYEWMLQLMKLFYDHDHYVKASTPEGADQAIAFDRTDFEDGINVNVVPGSALPKDKAAIRQDAMQLASAGMMTPRALYEIFEFPDPEKMAYEFLNWKMGRVSSEPPITPEEQARREQKAAMGASGEERVKQMIAQNEEVLGGGGAT